MKTTQILKAMPVGVLAGAAIFFIPFPFRFFFGFLLIFFAFRFFPEADGEEIMDITILTAIISGIHHTHNAAKYERRRT